MFHHAQTQQGDHPHACTACTHHHNLLLCDGLYRLALDCQGAIHARNRSGCSSLTQWKVSASWLLFSFKPDFKTSKARVKNINAVSSVQ